MASKKSCASDRKSSRASRHNVRVSATRRTTLVFGICKPNLMLLAFAHILLALYISLALIIPNAVMCKLLALIAYWMLAGHVLYRIYRVWRINGKKPPPPSSAVTAPSNGPPKGPSALDELATSSTFVATR